MNITYIPLFPNTDTLGINNLKPYKTNAGARTIKLWYMQPKNKTWRRYNVPIPLSSSLMKEISINMRFWFTVYATTCDDSVALKTFILYPLNTT